MLETTTYAVSDLFYLQQDDNLNGNPHWTNMNVKLKNGVKAIQFTGPGIYAYFFDNSLIYIGKFRGINAKTPFSGNILRARWDKHLGAFTMRGRKVSVNQNVLNNIQGIDVDAPNGEFWDDLRNADAVTLTTDRGMVASWNRVCFAGKFWSSFSKLEGTQTDRETLARFRVSYVKVPQAEPVRAMAPSAIRKAVSCAETALINEFQPCCNGNAQGNFLNQPHDIDHVNERIANALRDAFEAVSAKSDHMRTKATVAPAGGEAAPAGGRAPVGGGVNMGEDEQNFLNSLNGDEGGIQFVNQFRAQVPHPLEVYFTAIDMRVGIPRGANQRTVLMTMVWQRQRQRFLCKVRLELNLCTGCGFNPDQVQPLSNQQMLAKISLYPAGNPGAVDQIQNLICVLNQARMALLG